MWVRPLIDSDATCGGKAVGLARLLAAGLPVPDGFVVDDRAFRDAVGELPTDPAALGHALEQAAARIAEYAPPAELVAEVERWATALGRLAVRSSATLEDTAAGSGAGVFESVIDVPAADVWRAIRSVWTSALTPLAAQYARARAIHLGVIVQRYLPGERVIAYTRKPGGTSAVVQRGIDVRELARDAGDPLVALALRAEQAIDASATGADVELVVGDATWIVQARPIVAAPAPARMPPPPALLAALVADGRRWVWDVTHNPDPLSPAQIGLVERVESAQIAPWSMRICAGYLYTTPRGAPPTTTVRDHVELATRAAAIEADLARILDTGADTSLPTAIARYLELYRRWSCELVPLIAAARAAAPATSLDGARPSAVEGTLLAAARGEIDEATAVARLAPLSPTWDVAVPSFGERPDVIRTAIARARSSTTFHEVAAARDGASELARAAADLAERDDLWFARAQHLVRRALLDRACALGIEADEICWLSLDDALAGLGPDEAHRRASAAKAAAERAARWAMPLVIGGEHHDERPVLRGFGSGAHVSGRVVRFASLAAAIHVGRGDIIVTRAITPALAVFVVGCAAIISETGGPLDHGAAIARELGIPFIVGCKDAWSLLRDGMIATIDHDDVIV